MVKIGHMEEIIQREQTERNIEWIRGEGGREKPVKLETYQQPLQQRRINWIIEHCMGTNNILEVGCSWGYVLNMVQGRTGIDINQDNIERARIIFPCYNFDCGDVTKGLPYANRSFDIVLLSEILEHISWDKVGFVVREALRVARQKVIITLPIKDNIKCACCFKHKWVPTPLKISSILQLFKNSKLKTGEFFVYIETNVERNLL